MQKHMLNDYTNSNTGMLHFQNATSVSDPDSIKFYLQNKKQMKIRKLD
jgi:hypothetical protein